MGQGRNRSQLQTVLRFRSTKRLTRATKGARRQLLARDAARRTENVQHNVHWLSQDRNVPCAASMALLHVSWAAVNSLQEQLLPDYRILLCILNRARKLSYAIFLTR